MKEFIVFLSFILTFWVVSNVILGLYPPNGLGFFTGFVAIGVWTLGVVIYEFFFKK